MRNIEELAAEALTLPIEDRLLLADVLESSLASEDLASEWAVEIDKRLRAYDAGEIPARDAMEMLARLRQKRLD